MVTGLLLYVWSKSVFALQGVVLPKRRTFEGKSDARLLYRVSDHYYCCAGLAGGGSFWYKISHMQVSAAACEKALYDARARLAGGGSCR